MTPQLLVMLHRFMQPPFTDLHVCSVDVPTFVTVPFTLKDQTGLETRFWFEAEYQPGKHTSVVKLHINEASFSLHRGRGTFLGTITEPMLSSVNVEAVNDGTICFPPKEAYETGFILGYLICSFDTNTVREHALYRGCNISPIVDLLTSEIVDVGKSKRTER